MNLFETNGDPKSRFTRDPEPVIIDPDPFFEEPSPEQEELARLRVLEAEPFETTKIIAAMEQESKSKK